MRTTLTLDDDVAAKLKAEARRAGRPFREIVNETLRRGWRAGAQPPRRGSSESPRATSAISGQAYVWMMSPG